MDKDKQPVRPSNPASSQPSAVDSVQSSSRARSDKSASVSGQKRESDGLYDLLPELRPPKLSPEAIAAAMQAMQIDADEMDSDKGFAAEGDQEVCSACGRKNRRGNRFCAMCGEPLIGGTPEAKSARGEASPSKALTPDVLASGAAASSAVEPAEMPNGTHHYHHHYHHHFFPGGQDGVSMRAPVSTSRDPERLRMSPALKGEATNRAEAAVRRVTQDWVLACNTKHLDDLLELYAADALVMRSNYPSVRGAAAIREFFFNALDAGFGEVEVEPLRVEVVGTIAYEAGRCKALVPGGTAGKRREERGKYLWVFAKQNDGDWKLAADCWSSDLTLPVGDPEIVLATGAKPGTGRKAL